MQGQINTSGFFITIKTTNGDVEIGRDENDFWQMPGFFDNWDARNKVVFFVSTIGDLLDLENSKSRW